MDGYFVLSRRYSDFDFIAKEMLNPSDHRFNPELDFHYTNVGVA